jgi:ribosomal protein S20
LGVTVERLKQALMETRSEMGPAPRGFGGGHFPMPMGPGGMMRGPLGVEFRAAADTLGIPVDQLRTELRGHSLADVATSHGKNPADVATALKNAATEQIDQAVASGKIQADQAARLKERVSDRIDTLINRTVPDRASSAGERWSPRGGPRERGPQA